MSNAEFFQRLAEMLNRVVEASANNALQHYISADSLKYLIDPSADIACSSSLYLDDPNETITGARRFLDWLASNTSLSAAHREALDSKIVALVRERASYCPLAPFVFCLTDRSDEPVYWCRRIKDGGFAVAFDKKALHERIDAINALPAGSPFGGRLMFLIPVLYLESNEQHIPQFFELLYKQRRDAFDCYANGAPSAGCNEVLAQVLVAAAIVKDEKYAVEREWRIVLHPAPGDFEEAKGSLERAVKEKQANPMPRLETGIFRTPVQGDLREIVRCIYVSPQGDADTSRFQLENRLRTLPQRLTGDEVVADGFLFVRKSVRSSANLCSKCAAYFDCPDRKPDPVYKGKRWNRHQEDQSKVKKVGGKATCKCVIFAGLVVVLALGAACWFIFGNDQKVEIKESSKSRLIKEVEPAKAKTNEVKVVELTPEEKEKRRRAAGGMYTNDYGYVYNRPIKGNAITNDMNETVAKSFADEVFDNFVDRSIGDLIDTEPGTAFVGDSRSLFGPSFKKKFLESLEVPIIVSRDDPPEVATLKRAVVDAKIDLKARLDAGEDISEIMVQARDELQSLGLYKAELEKELDKIARDRSLTEEDMNDFVTAANKMMAERGMGPLTMPRMAARRFERERQLKQLQEQQNQ